MAKNTTSRPASSKTRYEYRVWGKRRRARKRLEAMADDRTVERVRDCYLLTDDPTWNAKIRDNTLKLKQLVNDRKGFEQWTSDRHRSVETTPSPFDDVFEQLRLDRPQRGKKYDLIDEIAKLDPDAGVRAMFVSKKRRRYRIGDMRAEYSEIRIDDTGEVLHTLSIQGEDLGDLTGMRKKLGLSGEDNVAVHSVLVELDD